MQAAAERLIRECGPGDIAALEEALPTGLDAHAHFLAASVGGRCTHLVALDDVGPVGSALVRWHGRLDDELLAAYPGAVEISDLAVTPEEQGKGHGTALVRAAEQVIATRCHGVPVLGVSAGNPRAAALYARLGYADSGVSTHTRARVAAPDGVRAEVVEQTRWLVRRPVGA